MRREDAERRRSMHGQRAPTSHLAGWKKPLGRAKYLLHLAGHDVGAEKQYGDAGRFPDGADGMARGVAEARAAGNHHELEHLHHRLGERMRGAYDELAALLDDTADFERRRIASAV